MACCHRGTHQGPAWSDLQCFVRGPVVNPKDIRVAFRKKAVVPVTVELRREPHRPKIEIDRPKIEIDQNRRHRLDPLSLIAGQARYFPPPKQHSRFPTVDGGTVKLNKATPRACLLTGQSGRTRLVVSGCAPIPTRRARGTKKPKPVIEVLVLGQRYRLGGRKGINCDGETALPKAAQHVHVELKKLDAEITVTVGERPPGTRKKAPPKRWIRGRTEKSLEGRYRRPKPAV